MNTLDKIRAFDHVMAVDDERAIGNSIIVTLKDRFDFVNDPGCGVQGFDTVASALRGSRSVMVKLKHFPSTK